MSSKKDSSGFKKAMVYIKWAIILFVIWALWLIWFLYFSGRTPSRLLGEWVAQVLTVSNMAEEGFVSLSFDKRGTATVKDLTFMATDWYVYTREYRDVSPFEWIIRWVPYGQETSLIQSRAISRWTGGAVNLEIPEGCIKILWVDIGYSGSNERVKNLTCKKDDGKIISKEYREWFIDRFFEWYLEIKAK